MNGDVKITLGGREAFLKCSLGAAMKVDEQMGGFVEAMRALTTFRLSAFVCIIAAGLEKPQQDVREAVWREGMTSLIGPVTAYLELLGNGGRKTDEVMEAAKTGEG